MIIRRLSVPSFGRETKLLIAAAGLFALCFYGMQQLLKVLYLLRLGHGPEYVGLFGAAGAFAYMGMGVPSGALGNRFGTRRVMLVGGAITVVCTAILPLVEIVPSWAQYSWPVVTQVILVAGWSMFNVNLVPALVATTGARQYSSALATNSALRGLGTFVGTVTGGLLPGLFAGLLGQTIDATAPYRLGLWFSAALGVTALVPLYLVGQVKRTSADRQAASRGPFPLLLMVLVMLHVYLSHGGWAACQAFCSAYMDIELNLSPSSIGLITGAGQFVAMLAPLLTPRLAARLGNGWLLLLTSVGIAVSLLPLGLIPNWAGAGLGRLGVLSLSAIWLTALQVFQMDLVRSEWHALAYGALSTAMGLSFGSVSLAGGYIIAAASYNTLFLLGSGVSLAGVVFIWPLVRRPGLGPESAAASSGAE